MPGNLNATVDRFEQELAVLRLDDGQELVVAKSLLPQGVAEGGRLVFTFTSDAEDEEARAQAARKLLTGILQGQ